MAKFNSHKKITKKHSSILTAILHKHVYLAIIFFNKKITPSL